MRKADCSIAMAHGSQAARQAAQVVLLDSDFTALPHILLEGRRVVNNMTRVAGVFFVKTVYSILLSLFCVLTDLPFPLIPIQVTLIDLFIEGYPAPLSPIGERLQGGSCPVCCAAPCQMLWRFCWHQRFCCWAAELWDSPPARFPWPSTWSSARWRWMHF